MKTEAKSDLRHIVMAETSAEKESRDSNLASGNYACTRIKNQIAPRHILLHYISCCTAHFKELCAKQPMFAKASSQFQSAGFVSSIEPELLGKIDDRLISWH